MQTIEDFEIWYEKIYGEIVKRDIFSDALKSLLKSIAFNAWEAGETNERLNSIKGKTE